MAAINLTIKERIAQVTDTPLTVPSGMQNVDAVTITCDDEWTSYGTKKLVIKTLTGLCGEVDFNASGEAVLPAWSLEHAGLIYVSVKGINGTKILTSTIVCLKVAEGGSLGDLVAPYDQKTIHDLVEDIMISGPDAGGVNLKNRLSLTSKDGLIYICVDGAPVGEGIKIEGSTLTPKPDVVIGSPVADITTATLTKNQTKTIGIKLSRKPSEEQTISILTDTRNVTVDKSSLSFTPADWDDWQYVTITVADITEDETVSFIMRNCDELLTDTTVPLILLADAYAVDQSFPGGAHIVTAEDFEGVTAVSGYGAILKKYTGDYTNLIVPNEIEYNGASYSPVFVSKPTFSENESVEYIYLEDGIRFTNAASFFVGVDNATSMFWSCSALKGVRLPENMELIDNPTYMFNNCTNLKFVQNLETTRKVTSFGYMFKNCSSIEYVQDLSGIDTGREDANRLQDGVQMFMNCTSLKKVYGLPKLTNTTDAFNGCTSLEEALVPETVGYYDVEFNGGHTNQIYATRMFSGCTNLRKLTILNSAATPGLPAAFNNPCQIYVKDAQMMETIKNATNNQANVTVLPYGSGGASKIVVWGDSTSSPATTWIEWPARLADKLPDFTIKNQAVSGEYTTSTSARQGGNAIKAGAFTIPAEGSAELTLTTADGQTFGANPVFSAGGAFNPCTIAGVDGTISQGAGGAYKFTRLEPGNEVSVPAGSLVVSKADESLNSADVMLVAMGSNSGWNEKADDLIKQLDLMVTHFGGEKYIICGPWGGKHLRSDALMATVKDFEAKAKAKFGDHWLNIREYMIESGLLDNSLTASALDNERIDAGKAPASLLGGGTPTAIKMLGTDSDDDVHPNAYGANSMTLAFYKKGVELGYWTEE